MPSLPPTESLSSMPSAFPTSNHIGRFYLVIFFSQSSKYSKQHMFLRHFFYNIKSKLIDIKDYISLTIDMQHNKRRIIF